MANIVCKKWHWNCCPGQSNRHRLDFSLIGILIILSDFLLKKLSSFAKLQFLYIQTYFYTKNIWQFGKISVLVNFMEVLQNCLAFFLCVCVSVSLARHNLRGLRALFLQKNPALDNRSSRTRTVS